MRFRREVMLFAIILLSRVCVCQSKGHSIVSLPDLMDRNVVAMVPWGVGDPDFANLICIVRQTSQNGPDDARSERVLEIYSMNRSSSSISLVYRSDVTPDLLLNIYPLGESNGRLVTIWTGGSAHNIVVFAYINGRVQKVLDVYSRDMPEVIIDKEERESILVTEMDMVNGKWKRNSGAKTDVYKWNGTTYQKLGRVPWGRRLQCVSVASCSRLK